MNIPCKDCERRYVGCHSTCQDYLNFIAEHKKLKKKMDEESKFFSYKVERKISYWRKLK